jgi:hypothetical protein
VKRLLLFAAVLSAAALTAAALPADSAAEECMGTQATTPDCGGAPPAPACSNGYDDDGDGAIDMGDPGCTDGSDTDEYNAPTSEGGGGGGGGGSSCSGVVILYEHIDYGGRCWGFSEGQYSYLGEASDQASSVQVADGYVVTLFADGDYAGWSHNSETDPSPWGWNGIGNDNVSSIAVAKAAEADYYDGSDATDDSAFVPSSTKTASTKTASTEAASSCARVGDAVVRNSTISGRRQWRYGLAVSFCWSGGTITKVENREIIAEVRTAPFPFNVAQGWRYSPNDFQPGENSGTQVILRATGTFDFCTFKYGCILTRQPWVRIDLRGSGDAYCTSSARTSSHACQRGPYPG